jgi:hypothetical protein
MWYTPLALQTAEAIVKKTTADKKMLISIRVVFVTVAYLAISNAFFPDILDHWSLDLIGLVFYLVYAIYEIRNFRRLNQ